MENINASPDVLKAGLCYKKELVSIVCSSIEELSQRASEPYIFKTLNTK